MKRSTVPGRKVHTRKTPDDIALLPFPHLQNLPQPPFRDRTVLLRDVDPDVHAVQSPGDHAGRPRACEGIEDDVALVAEELECPGDEFLREHGRVAVLLHPPFGGNRPAGDDPLLELVGRNIRPVRRPLLFEVALGKDLEELPRVLEVRVARALPAPPGGVLAVVVVLLPEDLALPDEAAVHEVPRDDVVARDVVGKERLDVDDDPPPELQHADALVEDGEELGKVPFPVDAVRGRVVAEAEVVGRRGDDDVNALGREGF